MSALAVISTNDSGFADISSEVINPAGQSEQYADGVVQPEWLQNCHANQNKFRDDIASKKTELNEGTSIGKEEDRPFLSGLMKRTGIERVIHSSFQQ